MTNQTIDLTLGEVRYTFPRTVTAAPRPDGTPTDITTDQVLVALGTSRQPGAWIAPDVIEHSSPSTVVVQLLVGGTLKPDPGTYRLWVKISDDPEIVPLLSPDVLVIT